MSHTDQFITFLDSLKNDKNAILVESVKEAYSILESSYDERAMDLMERIDANLNNDEIRKLADTLPNLSDEQLFIHTQKPKESSGIYLQDGVSGLSVRFTGNIKHDIKTLLSKLSEYYGPSEKQKREDKKNEGLKVRTYILKDTKDYSNMAVWARPSIFRNYVILGDVPENKLPIIPNGFVVSEDSTKIEPKGYISSFDGQYAPTIIGGIVIARGQDSRGASNGSVYLTDHAHAQIGKENYMRDIGNRLAKAQDAYYSQQWV